MEFPSEPILSVIKLFQQKLPILQIELENWNFIKIRKTNWTKWQKNCKMIRETRLRVVFQEVHIHFVHFHQQVYAEFVRISLATSNVFSLTWEQTQTFCNSRTGIAMRQWKKVKNKSSMYEGTLWPWNRLFLSLRRNLNRWNMFIFFTEILYPKTLCLLSTVIKKMSSTKFDNIRWTLRTKQNVTNTFLVRAKIISNDIRKITSPELPKTKEKLKTFCKNEKRF